jgi:hypothetical protein
MHWNVELDEALSHLFGKGAIFRTLCQCETLVRGKRAKPLARSASGKRKQRKSECAASVRERGTNTASTSRKLSAQIACSCLTLGSSMGYEPEGREFESLRARHVSHSKEFSLLRWCCGSLTFPPRIALDRESLFPAYDAPCLHRIEPWRPLMHDPARWPPRLAGLETGQMHAASLAPVDFLGGWIGGILDAAVAVGSVRCSKPSWPRRKMSAS